MRVSVYRCAQILVDVSPDLKCEIVDVVMLKDGEYAETGQITLSTPDTNSIIIEAKRIAKERTL